MHAAMSAEVSELKCLLRHCREPSQRTPCNFNSRTGRFQRFSHCPQASKPGGHVRTVPNGPQLVDARRAVRPGADPGRHLWRALSGVGDTPKHGATYWEKQTFHRRIKVKSAPKASLWCAWLCSGRVLGFQHTVCAANAKVVRHDEYGGRVAYCTQASHMLTGRDHAWRPGRPWRHRARLLHANA